MKRDLSLIREILLKLESVPLRPGRFLYIRPDAAALPIEGYEPDLIMYHLNLLEEVGFVVFAPSKPLDGSLHFQKLTWTGHDYLDAVRDPEIWSKTKKGAEAAGGFTLDLVKDLAKGFIKKKVEEHTGVKL